MTAAIFAWTADQLKRGEPPWWKGLAKAWEKRTFVSGIEAPHLYMAALHFEALSDEDCPLVKFFPSCGGTAEADPIPGLARFLAAPPPSFFENLRVRHRRAYVPGRAVLWMGPALLHFHSRGLPYYLVQVDAGAGLDLAADAAKPLKHFDSELVSARIGLDPEPLDMTDIAHRRWATASLAPDEPALIAELDAAIDLVQAKCSQEGTFLQLAPCPADKAAAFIAKNVPPDDPDVGLLVFNMGCTSRMDDERYAKYAAGMASLLKSWGDRGLWVEVETVRGEAFSSTLQLRAHRLVDGVPRTMIVASFDLNARQHSDNEAAAAAFLAVKPLP